MTNYQKLVRALFQQGFTIMEINVKSNLKSFSSKGDKLIIINGEYMADDEKYLELLFQIKLFEDDSFKILL